MEFSFLINEKLKDKNLSAVARSIGMPPSLLHDWVKGRRVPSFRNLKHVKALAQFLNISLSELMGELRESSVIKEFSFFDGGKEFFIRIERR